METALEILFYVIISFIIAIPTLNYFKLKKPASLLFDVGQYLAALLVTGISFFNGSILIGILTGIVAFGLIISINLYLKKKR